MQHKIVQSYGTQPMVKCYKQAPHISLLQHTAVMQGGLVVGSLYSKPRYGLEQHFFFLFLGLINIFVGSLYSKPLHVLELVIFSAACFLDV